VSLLGAEEADEENGQPEPEQGALSDSTPAGREGELDELLETTVSYGTLGRYLLPQAYTEGSPTLGPGGPQRRHRRNGDHPEDDVRRDPRVRKRRAGGTRR